METLTDTKRQEQPEATRATPVDEKLMQQEHASATAEQLKIENKARSGANWFFWIAALSMINSIITVTGSDWSFIVGLGVTQVFDAIGAEFGARAVTFGMSVLAAGVFASFGVFAGKRHNWAYVVGMIFYALDGLLFLLVGDLLSVGFHVFVLFWIFNGYRANKALAGYRD